MNIALLADIHGNYAALEAVLEDIACQAVERIVVLGDLVFKGPEPEKCVAAVQALQTTVIRGNIDELVGEGQIQPGFAQNEQHAQALLTEMAWTRARLSEAQLKYLRTLPFVHEIDVAADVRLRCVHATPQSILTSILPSANESELQSLFEVESGNVAPQIVVYAHIHLPYVRYFNGKMVVNTGSVGLTFDGDPRASYAILRTATDGSSSVELRRVRYDVERTVAGFTGADHPFGDSVIDALRSGRKPM